MKNKITALLLAVLTVSLIGCGNVGTGLKTYIYSFPTHNGTTSYAFTDKAPDELEDWQDDYTFIREYRVKEKGPTIADGSIDGTVVFYDGSYFLYNVNTGKETPFELETDIVTISSMFIGDTVDNAVLALFDTEPDLFAIYSISEEKMLSEYKYRRCGEKYVNGCVNLLDENMKAVLMDPKTGEIIGEGDISVFEEWISARKDK